MAGNPFNNDFIVMTVADFVGDVDDGHRWPPARQRFLPFELVSKVSLKAWGGRARETCMVTGDTTVNQLVYFLDLGAPFPRVCKEVALTHRVDLVMHVHSLAHCPWWNSGGCAAGCIRALARESTPSDFQTRSFHQAFVAGRLAGQLEAYSWLSNLFFRLFRFRAR